MLIRLLISLFFLITFFDSSAQDYQWGTSDKYRKEDSLFLIWEHHFISPSDSDVLKNASIILDSLGKIKKERNIHGHMYMNSHKQKTDSLLNAYQPIMNKIMDSLRKDSTKSKTNKMILIPLDSINKENNNFIQ